MVDDALKSTNRTWSRGYFAFWILLTGCSAYYLLFTGSTDPTALESQTFPTLGAPGSGLALTTGPAADLMKSVGQGHQELSETQARLRELSQQIAGVDTRLKPIEEFVALAKSAKPKEKPFESGGVLRPAPSPETLVPRERLPETVAQNALQPIQSAETVAAQEDFTFCRKWAGLGRIVCRRENGTVLVVGPAEVSTLANEEASAEPPAVAVAPLQGFTQEDAEAVVASSAGETDAPNEEATEIDNGTIRYGIELGSAIQQAELMLLWRKFLTSHVALAAGLQPRRVLTAEKRWRLIAGPFANVREAKGACASLKKASKPCRVSLYTGDRL